MEHFTWELSVLQLSLTLSGPQGRETSQFDQGETEAQRDDRYIMSQHQEKTGVLTPGLCSNFFLSVQH